LQITCVAVACRPDVVVVVVVVVGVVEVALEVVVEVVVVLPGGQVDGPPDVRLSKIG
jgi:hypothetical protein